MCSEWGQECEEGLGRLLQCTTVLTDVCFTGSRVFPQANNIRTVLLHGCFHTAVVWPWTSAPKVPPWPLQGRPAKVGGLLPASSPSDPAHLFILRDTHFEILNYKRTKGEVSATRLLCFWGLTSHPSAQTLWSIHFCSSPSLCHHKSRSWVVFRHVLRACLPLPLYPLFFNYLKKIAVDAWKMDARSVCWVFATT